MNQPLTILEAAMEIAFPHEFLEHVAKTYGAPFARECAMSTSVGGIGPLLRERIIEQGETAQTIVGVTLLYDNVWVQNWHEWGQLYLQKREIASKLKQLLKPTDLNFDITFYDGAKAAVEVWELSYGKSRVYFLSCPGVTDVVYPGGKDAPADETNVDAWAYFMRLRQSWLVGRGALALCRKRNTVPDIAVLSETPTIFIHHKTVHDEFQNDDFFAKTKYIFNDHTPLEYAHPIWDKKILDTVKLDETLYQSSPGWSPSKMSLDVTGFLVGLCDSVYGVAKKHGEVMKAMPSLHPFINKIQYVTNGVRKEDWQAAELNHANELSDEALFAVKTKYRDRLLNWAWRHCNLWPFWIKSAATRRVVLWTRRITSYKRLDLLGKMLAAPDGRQRFLNLNLTLFFGGRIHQQDNQAQELVYKLVDQLEQDKDLKERIFFIDNFNVWEAPLLFQGADAALMLADDTREASATGFMKAQMNAGAIIATSDGAVPEFVRTDGDVNGFDVPYIKGEPTAEGLLQALEAFDRAYRDPKKTAAIMRSALSATNHISVARTVKEMMSLYQRTLDGVAI
jgi:glucan phosphorylase